MVEMGIRQQLAPRPEGKQTYLPPVCNTLSKNERRSFCECLHGIKSLVSMKDQRFSHIDATITTSGYSWHTT
jgi:hypothetical protein